MRSFMQKNSLILVSLLLAGLLPLQAQAHRTWLLPSSTQVDGKEPWITVDAATSDNLFAFENMTQKLDGLHISAPDGSALQAENLTSGRLRSSFDLRLSKPGTYRISLVNESVMASYQLNGEAKRWRGSTEALAREIPAGATDLQTTRQHGRVETFVTVGHSSPLALKPGGSGLELQPLTDLSELQPGQPARFRFLLDGRPAAALALSAIPGGVRYRGVLNEIHATTDAQGEFAITWPEAGMYWLNATFSTPPLTPGGQPERRVTYGATLEVLPQ